MGDPGIPQPGLIPDTSDLPIEAPQSELNLQNASQAMTPQVQAPVGNKTVLKSLLTNFFQGAGSAMMAHAGIDTPEQAAAKRQQLAIQQQNANSLEGLRNAQEQSNQLVPYQLPDAPDGTLGEVIHVPQKSLQALAVQHMKNVASQPKPINVPGVGAYVWDPQLKDYKKLEGSGGLEVPLDATSAQLAGVPDMAGKPLGKQGWGVLNQALQAGGFHVVDMGTNGPDGGMWVVNKGGEKIHQISPQSVALARGQGFAASRAAVTPFQTFDAEGNLRTISNLQAVQSGVPSAATYQSLYGPTGATKTAGQAAGAVSSHIPEFKQSVQNLAAKGQLGPVLGRINEFMNRGYGGSDPDIAAFVTTLKLLNSGTVRAHFGARGGQQILASFNNILNTAQTPEAIIGSIDAIDSFLKTYGDVGTLKGPRTTIPSRTSGGGQKATHRYNPATRKIEAIP